jgi:hypothetical protein
MSQAAGAAAGNRKLMMRNALQPQAGVGPLLIRQFGGTVPVPARDVRLNDIIIIDEEKVVVCRPARDGEPSRSSRPIISLCRHELPDVERSIDGLPTHVAQAVGDVVTFLV